MMVALDDFIKILT